MYFLHKLLFLSVKNQKKVKKIFTLKNNKSVFIGFYVKKVNVNDKIHNKKMERFPINKVVLAYRAIILQCKIDIVKSAQIKMFLWGFIG